MLLVLSARTLTNIVPIAEQEAHIVQRQHTEERDMVVHCWPRSCYLTLWWLHAWQCQQYAQAE